VKRTPAAQLKEQLMTRLGWCGFSSAAACLLILSTGGAFLAQDKSVPAEKHDNKALRDSLKDVVNSGAELFNKYGDHAGCYRLFQGALIAVKPFVAPAMQEEIDTAITEAEKLPKFNDRAFALRKVIDRIRNAVPAPASSKMPATTTPKMPATTTLWTRLGGESNVRKVVDDFTKAAAGDPKVNLSRNGKYPLDEPSVQLLENQLVDFISSATGGPRKYQGKSMKDAHKGMGITNAEYDAASKHLRKALEKNGAKADDVAAVMKEVESLRKDIVEEK
jgi:hemoglobin